MATKAGVEVFKNTGNPHVPDFFTITKNTQELFEATKLLPVMSVVTGAAY